MLIAEIVCAKTLRKDAYLSPREMFLSRGDNEIAVKEQFYKLQKQQSDQAASCIACKTVLKKSYITATQFYKLFNIGNFIPVVPSQCKLPQPISLIVFQILRVYGFIASLSLYLIVLSLIIIAVRWTIGGISTKTNMDIKRNATNLIFALIIVLTISTLLFELLRAIGVNENSLNLKG